MAHDDVLLQLLPAEVKVAVFEPQLLVCVCAVDYFKRRSLRLCKYAQIGHENFYIPSFKFGIGAFALFHNPFCHKHIFRAAAGCLFKNIPVRLVVKSKLDNSRAVP